MPNNKNQHFVPQFYLRNFSSDRKSISSFLIEAERMIPRVSIKDQCSRDYFYPDLEYEHDLGRFEEQCRQIINEIVLGRKVSFTRSDLFWLRAFTILQRSRTRHEASIVKDSFQDFRDYMRSQRMGDDLKREIEGYVNSEKNTVALLASNLGPGIIMTSDISCKILKFVGEGAFLTSDDPVFMYNTFLESRGKMNYGLSAMGLILFLPLSDRYAVILYDGGIYKVGQKKKQVVEFDSPSDLYWMNMLTILNADKVVFFKQDTQNQQHLTDLVRRAKSTGQSKEMKLESLEAVDGRSELIHMYAENFYIGAGFSFVKLLDKARGIRFGSTIRMTDYSRPFCNTLLMMQKQPHIKVPSMTYRPKE